MKKWENSLLYTRNDYEVQQKNSEMEKNINLNSQKKMLIRISAMEETVRIRPIGFPMQKRLKYITGIEDQWFPTIFSISSSVKKY